MKKIPPSQFVTSDFFFLSKIATTQVVHGLEI